VRKISDDVDVGGAVERCGKAELVCCAAAFNSVRTCAAVKDIRSIAAVDIVGAEVFRKFVVALAASKGVGSFPALASGPINFINKSTVCVDLIANFGVWFECGLVTPFLLFPNIAGPPYSRHERRQEAVD
jgi:hypothetical protein